MNRLDSAVQGGSAGLALAGGLGSWVSIASDAALQLFGVPLPVLLAALTGACGARAFLPACGFWQAVAVNAFWTLAGTFLPQLVLWVASSWISSAPPPGVMAGAALLIAAFGQRVGPIVWESGGEALRRRLDGLWSSKGEGQ